MAKSIKQQRAAVQRAFEQALALAEGRNRRTFQELEQDPRGHNKSYDYDAAGLLTKASRPLSTGDFQDFARIAAPDGRGRIVGRTTALGRLTTYQIIEETDDSETRIVTGPDSLTATTHLGIDDASTTTLADGTTITVAAGPDPRFGMLSPIPTAMTIATGGKTLAVETSRATTLSNPNDVSTVATQVDTVTINGKTFTTTLDNTGLSPVVTRTTHAGRTTVTTLDTQGRPTQVEVLGALGLLPAAMSYDDGSGNPSHKGLLRSITQGSGPEERRYDFSYDANGNLSQISAPLAKVVTFGYDAATRVTEKVFPDGERVRFGYDAAGNLDTLAQPGTPSVFAPFEVHTFQSEPRDLLSSYTAPDIGLSSHDTLFAYTADRELDSVTRPDGLVVDPSYDAAGRLDALAVPGGLVDYSYFADTDPVAPGKLERIDNLVDGVALDFGYAGALLTSTSWSGAVSGSVLLDYDDDLRVISEDVAGSVIGYSYADADGLLTQAGALSLSLDPDTALLTGTSLGAMTDTIGYNGFAEPTSYTASHNGTPLYTMTLSYDELGRIVHKTEEVLGVTTGYAYVYDEAGRLSEVHSGAGDCGVVSCTLSASYAYDPNGNRTSVTEGGPPVTASYDAQDRLLSFGGASYGYTAAGELQSKTDASGTTTFAYDVLGDLRTVSLPTGTTVSYVVDGLERRVAKKLDGVMQRAWLYGGAPGPIAELGPDGATLEARFVYGTRGHVPDYMVKAGTTYRFVTDQLGSVRLVVDVATGSVAQRIDYDPWGRVLLDTNPGFQPFGFAGGLYDPDTGLVRFGARDYDAEVGRWTAKDPVMFAGSQANLYGYALGDPINRIDPAGLFSIDEIERIARAVIAGGAGAGLSTAAQAVGGISLTTIGAGLAAVTGLGLAAWQGYELWKDLNPEIITAPLSGPRAGDPYRKPGRRTMSDCAGLPGFEKHTCCVDICGANSIPPTIPGQPCPELTPEQQCLQECLAQ